jgi:hypothetical protein
MLKQDLTKNLIYLLLLVTPLIFVSNTNELYEFPKMFFVYTTGATIFLLFAVQKLLSGEKILRPTRVVLLFLVSFLLSTVFSGHLYTSIWGYFSRFNDGLVSIAIYFLIYLVVINKFSKEDFSKLFFVICLGSIPISLYGIFQHFGSEPITRVYSTIGQPNWLAAYLLFVLLYSLRRLHNKVYLLVFCLGYMCFWFTYSLSGFFVMLLLCPMFILELARQLAL